MATLTGELISETYDSLLKVTDNNTITGVKKRITDGFGNEIPLQLSSTDIEIDGTLILSSLTDVEVATKFLSLKADNSVAYRTAAEVLSDIGGASSSSLSNYVTLNTIQSITQSKTFTQSIFFNNGVVLEKVGTLNKATTFANTSLTILNLSLSNSFGFNNNNNIYFSKVAGFGAELSFNNSANRIYTLQNNNGTLAFLSDIPSLANYVTLDTAQTITAAKTFSTSGGSDTLIINHSSGSGIALNITKGGNGEGIYVNKTSGTGNAVTIVGTLSATTLVKNGGTSSQFLKADGSIDSNFYALVSSLNNYLPTQGGTLTGALVGTSATFSGDLTIDTNTLFVDSTNNRVGIGTTTPAINLHVKGSGAYAGVRADNTGTTGGGFFAAYQNGSQIGIVGVSGAVLGTTGSDLAIFSETGKSILFMPNGTGTEAMRVNSNGNVGIGTTSPGAKFHVKQGASEIPLVIDSSSASNPSYTQYRVNNSGGWEHGMAGVGDSYKYLFSYGDFGTTNAKMTLTSGGNVGIGTTSPGAKLTILGSNSIGGSIPTNWAAISSGRFGIVNGNNSFYFDLGSTPYAELSTYNYSTGTTFPLVLQGNGGNVGIGTTTPNNLLHLYKASFPILTIQSSAYQSSLGIDTASGLLVLNNESNSALAFNTNATERMRITSGGDVLIGTTGGSHKLTVNVGSGADREMFICGVTGVSNGFRIRYDNATSTVRVSMTSLPTSSTGLSTGDIWNDSGTLKIVL
jgi:hypothetical protein